MTEPNPRRRQVYAAAAALAAVVAIIVIAVVASGDDEGGDAVEAVASTAPSTAPSTMPSAASSTVPSTVPSTSGPATTVPDGATTTAPDTGEPSADDTGATASTTAAPAGEGATTTTATPAPGSLVTVPTGTVPVADPIPPDEVGEFGTGVTAEIVTLEAVEGVAQLPGEISGPAVRVRVRLANGSDAVVNLSRVLVDVSYGPDRTPGLALGEPDAEPFIGELAAGDTAEGVYVFGVPLDARDQVQISVSYDVTAPILVFEGPAPTR